MSKYGLGVKNRFGFTFRLNIREQAEMQTLMDFYDFNDPQRVMKLAFEQLAMATNELKKKIKQQAKEQVDAKQTPPGDSGAAGPADDSPTGTTEQVESGSGTAATDATPADAESTAAGT